MIFTVKPTQKIHRKSINSSRYVARDLKMVNLTVLPPICRFPEDFTGFQAGSEAAGSVPSAPAKP
jgi:hypothetical protein